MTKSRWLGAAAALSILSLAACDFAANQDGAPASGEQATADKLDRIEMSADTSYLTAEEREVAYTVHHMARTWHNTTTLRTAMLQAERRLEQARERLAREQRRHAATKKKLARAEQRMEKAEGAGSRGRFGQRGSA